MTKPGDFFIGIQDFFAILLPGSAVVYFAVAEADARGVVSALDGAQATVAFAFAAYVVGHLVFLVGSYLDPLYDRWRKGRPKTDGAFLAADELRKRHRAALTGAAFSNLKWCRAFVSLHSSTARTELDYYEATSKFFRSLVVLFAFTTVVLFATRLLLPFDRRLLAALSAMLSWACFVRFRDQRWKLTELTYAYAVLIAALDLKPEARPGLSAPAHGAPPDVI